MSSSPRYRIHPAIGIARVGNTPSSEYFLGPELPNQRVKRSPDVGTAVPPFKSDGLVKRQAARFRIWEYTESDGVWTASREVSLDDADVAELTWSVHLANRKASFFRFDGLAGSKQHNIPNDAKRRNEGAPERLEIDPLPRSIGGRTAGPIGISRGTSATPAQERWPDPAPVPAITSLGELCTDDAGRLIVIPGAGIAARRDKAPDIADYANNPGWFDDVGDGPITATLRLRGSDGTITAHPVQGAWLLVGPPDFAPPLPQLVSLYDGLFDLAVRQLPIPSDESVYHRGELERLSGLAAFFRPDATPTYTVHFDTDIAPILRAAFAVTSVSDRTHADTIMDFSGLRAAKWAQLSDPDPKHAGVRRNIVNHLRKPPDFGSPAAHKSLAEDTDMPRLLGDDYGNNQGTGRAAFTVTPTQYAILQRWKAGDFVGSSLGPSSLLDPPEAPSVTPHGLDRAALECASGGAFFPGIEVGWLILEPSLFADPFRIRHGAQSPYLVDENTTEDATVGAGFFSRQMALPWLADFRDCKVERHPKDSTGPRHLWGWWPSQRPDSVYPSADAARAGDAKQRVPWHRATGPKRWSGDADLPSWGEMIENWWRFGFVVPVDADGHYAESERAEHIPESDDHRP